MLTTLQHQFAPCLPDRQERLAYSTHMCGLCHTLGDHYGWLSRLVTSHELILLNLLASAQRPDEPATVRRRCPLNPLRTVATNQDIASTFAAAVAIELANIKFGDDLQDSGGRDLAARLEQRLARRPHQTARQTLRDLRFNAETLDQLGERQARAEKDETQDPAGPSALASAELFAMTARLAARPENTDPLAAIGANFGAYVYLLDAYRDFPRDMARGDYNPLRRFGQRSAKVLSLSQAGLQWLLSRFEMIQSSVHESVPKLQLYRHHDLLVKLLCRPVDKIVLELSQRVWRPELTFRRWPWVEALQAGLFILPATESGTGLAGLGLTRLEPGEEIPGPASDPERKRERDGPCQGRGYWGTETCYYCDGGGHVQCGEPLNCNTDSCGQMPSGRLPDCETESCGQMLPGKLPDCSPGSCGPADGGKMDCPHVDSGGTDCGSCMGVDLGSCGGMDLSGCGHVDLSGCGHMDCGHCSNVDCSGCSGMDLGGCGGVDCGGCGN